ncbi:hydantoinase B/oxoprolinase family protein [Candidatus Acetothermia bacterium]|nr:hydantoinase B/oxoprolinase family protein [Candidatus Acetothermia bacterium]MBI3643653.1 hydantoinase B/oxoprolinase family protein [Candidatus Acetothermia bacterium]
MDPIQLEVLRNSLIGIAEEMWAALLRTALSPNIRERRDCSTALFDAAGRMIVQSESIPVHLGAMPFSVKAALEAFSGLQPGDVIILNDPFRGGAHLPDITLITPIFEKNKLQAIAANRAHHADVGGIVPGSVPGNSTEIFQEGLRIPPIKLWSQSELNQEAFQLILANVRTPIEREGDLRAQFASNETARKRLIALAERVGWPLLTQAMSELLDYSERRMRHEIGKLPAGVYEATDYLDDDGQGNEKLPIHVSVEIKRDSIHVDFTGSAPQVNGPLNAVLAVTSSAVFYTLRSLTDPKIPPNEGCYRPFSITAPAGTIVNAKFPAPVVGGNLETSQRIVDTLIQAVAQACPDAVMAGCQGTMNSITFGGINPRTGGPYTFYETLAGGFGARPDRPGIDAMHSHMTNTLNTPIELLETVFPVRVERYEIRENTGGAGKYRGGSGLIREIRVLADATFSLLADRRKTRPYGLFGGEPGAQGEDFLIRDGIQTRIAAKGTLHLKANDVVSIRTPGGGGVGRADSL